MAASRRKWNRAVPAYNRWSPKRCAGAATAFIRCCLPFNPDAACGGRDLAAQACRRLHGHRAVGPRGTIMGQVYRALKSAASCLFHRPELGELIFKVATASCRRTRSGSPGTTCSIDQLRSTVGRALPAFAGSGSSGVGLVPFPMQRLDHEYAAAVRARCSESRGRGATCSTLAADGAGEGRRRAGVHLPHDQCGHATALPPTSALGFRPAVDDLRRRSSPLRGHNTSAAPRRACSSCPAQRQAESESGRSSAIWYAAAA